MNKICVAPCSHYTIVNEPKATAMCERLDLIRSLCDLILHIGVTVHVGIVV